MQNVLSNDLSRLRCDIVVGTRPEAIKLAPVIEALRDEPGDFAVRVVTSGQHGEICRSALAAFGLAADVALDPEPVGPSLADSAGGLLRAFGRHIAQSPASLLLVQGDTTTAMAAALAAFYAKVPVAHVEAGLRSGDLANPFPEEANRKIIDAVSTIARVLPGQIARQGLCAAYRRPGAFDRILDRGESEERAGAILSGSAAQYIKLYYYLSESRSSIQTPL
jgi:UDP-N-acetylglucosamine 2-epimerase (non-hydrolysing)